MGRLGNDGREEEKRLEGKITGEEGNVAVEEGKTSGGKQKTVEEGNGRLL
jgi:hypothetical protein